jgi:hypothetical protein
MSRFERERSSVQILLALADSDEEEPQETKDEAKLNGNECAHYAVLRARLEQLGVEIQDGADPRVAYREARRLFKRAQSFYESVPLHPAVQKVGSS